MNETLYNNFEAVKELNRVDGFDPTKVMRRIVEPMEDGTSSERCYLDVAYRKLWFRLKYPQGAIKKFVREITDQFAIVEAKVYLDRSDPADNYIANAIVKRYFNPEDKLGDKYLELAETAAVGRALADAGFGIQFADSSESMDPNVVDTPVGLPQGVKVNTITGEVMQTPQPTAPAAANAGQNNPVNNPPAQTTVSTPPSVNVQNQAPMPTAAPAFTMEMPMETILPMMTMDYATKLIVDCGFYKGKTLGQVAMEKPAALEWYVNSYKGKNNILRAAAKFLLDRAAA